MNFEMTEAENKKSPTISVLLATYNGSAYLPALLDSLLSQIRLPDEIVICDDRSQDDTLDILKAFQARSPVLVSLNVNSENLGYQRNFLQGIRHCAGDYIAFCDQDDVWLPEKLERLHALIDGDDPPEMVFSDCELVDEHLQSLGRTGVEYLGISESDRRLIENGRLLEVLIFRPCVVGMTMLCQRKMLIANPPPVCKISHDYLISAFFSVHGRYRFCSQPLVKYRQHASNAIGMAAKKVKKRDWRDRNYVSSLNQDLADKEALLEYMLIAAETEPDRSNQYRQLLLDMLSFVQARIDRRLNFAGFFKPYPQSNALYLSTSQKRDLWLKDFRVYCRLSFRNIRTRLSAG